jgi:hypothetical protein
VAFPLLSQGLCGYPTDRGLAVARSVLSSVENDLTVYLTLA